MIFNLVRKYKLNKLIKRGLQISADCRIMGMPNFGSEPYLISIGSHVTLCSNITFITHDGATWVFRDKAKYRDVIRYGRTTVHDNCFIGYNVTILPGISIGQNSVVAAGSVVTKDVPPNTIVGGNPAKVISNTSDYANKLLDSTPEYNKSNYKTNKKNELLKLFPYPW